MIGFKKTQLQFVNRDSFFISRNVMMLALFLVFMAISGGNVLAAAVVDLAWDAVADTRVDHYEVHYGRVSGQYEHSLSTPGTAASVELTEAGAVYFFAARACERSGTNCSAFSNELSVTAPLGTDDGTRDRLTVDFSANVSSGVAPLTVTFAEDSTGAVTSREWAFGDGATSTGSTAVHTYVEPGVYRVALTVSGPAGSVSESKPAYVSVAANTNGSDPRVPGYSLPGSGSGGDSVNDSEGEVVASLPIEIGDMKIDHNWQRIDFERTFDDPVVIVKGLSGFGGDPAVVRIKDIDGEGFWVRVQEWDYLDGWHTREHASYIAMERGRYELPDGVLVEAGSLSTKATGAFEFQGLDTGFAQPPVVFVSVNSFNGSDAVTSRLRDVSANGFFVGLWEQERNRQSHVAERVDYIAWEQSAGEVQGLRYEVGLTAGDVDHTDSSIQFESQFGDLPVFVVDMQSTNGTDPCALRWKDLSAGAARLWVQEERSRDSETGHLPERVGYFAADVEG